MKEGQCSGRKGSGKGRSPAAARAPLSGPEREGRRLLSAASSSFGPRHLRGLYGPASWPVSRVTCAAVAPSTLPSWTHEDTSVHARGRDRSPEERRTRHITAAVMRLHSLQVCASSHAARPGCFSAPPLSHTHSRREPGEGRRIRDGEMLIIRGEATDSSQYIYIRGGTIHVFVQNRHGMRPYNEYRQFTPNPERGARSNAMLFDNRQQKNSECHELRT